MLAWICMESINANVLYLSSIDRIGCLRFRLSLSSVAGCVVHSVLCTLVYMSSAVSSFYVLLKQRCVLPRVQDIIRPSTRLLSSLGHVSLRLPFFHKFLIWELSSSLRFLRLPGQLALSSPFRSDGSRLGIEQCVPPPETTRIISNESLMVNIVMVRASPKW